MKFLAHFARIRAEVNVVLSEGEVARYEIVREMVNGYLVYGMTCKCMLGVGGGRLMLGSVGVL
jgi:hypothetical protein